MSNQLDADGEQRSQRISEEATVESKNYLLRVTAIALAILPGLSASLAVGCGIGYWLRSADSALPEPVKTLLGHGRLKHASPQLDVDGLLASGEAEDELSAYQGEDMQADADGSYVESLEHAAGITGATMHWGLDGEPCEGTEAYQHSQTLMLFCPATPDVVYVNDDLDSWPDVSHSASSLSYLKHELAHRSIYLRTGSTTPIVGDETGEALANSCAIKYLGASQADLAMVTMQHPEYDWSQETDHRADEVHAVQ